MLIFYWQLSLYICCCLTVQPYCLVYYSVCHTFWEINNYDDDDDNLSCPVLYIIRFLGYTSYKFIDVGLVLTKTISLCLCDVLPSPISLVV